MKTKHMTKLEDLIRPFHDNTKITKSYTKAVGATFVSEEILKSVKTGDLVYLEHDDNNAYDLNAVGVWDEIGKNRLGYINKNINQEIWKNMMQGDVYIGTVEVTGGGNKNIGLNLELRRLHNKYNSDVLYPEGK